MDALQDIFRSKKNIINLLVLLIIVLAIPIGVNLIKQIQTFSPRAASPPIVLVEGKCVVKRNGVLVAVCGEIDVNLTSPLGGPAAISTNP